MEQGYWFTESIVPVPEGYSAYFWTEKEGVFSEPFHFLAIQKRYPVTRNLCEITNAEPLDVQVIRMDSFIGPRHNFMGDSLDELNNFIGVYPTDIGPPQEEIDSVREEVEEQEKRRIEARRQEAV